VSSDDEKLARVRGSLAYRMWLWGQRLIVLTAVTAVVLTFQGRSAAAGLLFAVACAVTVAGLVCLLVMCRSDWPLLRWYVGRYLVDRRVQRGMWRDLVSFRPSQSR
jgi:hypothetical protein